MSRTINELNTTDTLVGEDKLVLWQEQSGATRAITAADAADYFSLAGGPYQPSDELLTSIAALGPTTTADRMIYTTAQDVAALTPITAFGRSILDDANAAAVFATLGADSVYARLAAPNTFTKGQSVILPNTESTNTIDARMGTSGAPRAVVASTGYVGVQSLVYSDQTGTGQGITAGMYGFGQANDGTEGIIVGGLFKGQVTGTWSQNGNLEAGAQGIFVDADSDVGGTLFGAGIHATATVTAGAYIRGMEIDTVSTPNAAQKFGIQIVSPNADTGVTSLSAGVNGSARTIKDEAAIDFVAIGAGVGFHSLLRSVKQDSGTQPCPTGGNLWYADGFTTTYGLAWNGVTFTGAAIQLGNAQKIVSRNAADNANVDLISLDGSNVIQIGASQTVAASSGDAIGINRAAGNDRLVVWRSGTSARWRLGVNATAEGGANAGSDFDLYAYDDAATFLGTYLSITRSNGHVTAGGVYNSTTASAANVFVASGGLLSRSTSALKYKKDVEPFETNRTWSMLEAIDDALIWYRSNPELCPGDNPEYGHYGVAADPLAGIIPQLVHFGKSGEVEGFAYERVIVPLVRAVMELRKELDQWKSMALNTPAPAGSPPSSSLPALPALSDLPSLGDDMQVGHMDEPEPIEIPPFLTPDPMDAVPDALRLLAEPGESAQAMQVRFWSLYLELNGKLMLNLASPEEIALHSRLHNDLHWIAPTIEGET